MPFKTKLKFRKSNKSAFKICQGSEMSGIPVWGRAIKTVEHYFQLSNLENKSR